MQKKFDWIQSAGQARKSDQQTIADGMASLVLMENAARAIAQIILQSPLNQRVLFLCGPGNNGADGLAAARLIKEEGRDPVCLLMDPQRLSPDEKVQLEAAQKAGVPFAYWDESSLHLIGQPWNLLVDALFGSGLSRPISGIYAQAIDEINALHVPVLAVDIPSGIDGNTGEILGCAVKASQTACLDTLKEGHIRQAGKIFSGQKIICPIGIFEKYHDPSFFVLNQKAAAVFLPARPLLCHKGTFGKVLLAGGSLSMQGALSMAAMACFHAGAGTVTLFTPQSAAMALASKLDLAMIIPATEKNGYFDLLASAQLKGLLDRYTVMAAGNGMGKGKGARAMTSLLLDSSLPLVLDADGLNCLALDDGLSRLKNRKTPVILTPHLAEFARISHQDLAQIQADPIQAARTFAQSCPQAVLVLKGEETIVAHGSKMAWLCRPNSALAKGGSGDVLCGLITGLLAQMPDQPFEAACLGVYIHNTASFQNIDPAFFTPLNLIAGMDAVFQDLRACQQKETKEDSPCPGQVISL